MSIHYSSHPRECLVKKGNNRTIRNAATKYMSCLFQKKKVHVLFLSYMSRHVLGGEDTGIWIIEATFLWGGRIQMRPLLTSVGTFHIHSGKVTGSASISHMLTSETACPLQIYTSLKVWPFPMVLVPLVVLLSLCRTSIYVLYLWRLYIATVLACFLNN